MNFEDTMTLFLSRYPHINWVNQPRQSLFAFVTWYNDFRHTDEAHGIFKLDEQNDSA